MTCLNEQYDFCHLFNQYPQLEATYEKTTIDMELTGIKIAAIKGFNEPETAKLKPTIL